MLQVRIVDDDAVGVLAFSHQEEKAFSEKCANPSPRIACFQVCEDFNGEKVHFASTFQCEAANSTHVRSSPSWSTGMLVQKGGLGNFGHGPLFQFRRDAECNIS